MFLSGIFFVENPTREEIWKGLQSGFPIPSTCNPFFIVGGQEAVYRRRITFFPCLSAASHIYSAWHLSVSKDANLSESEEGSRDCREGKEDEEAEVNHFR
jgi:hypothetical protein